MMRLSKRRRALERDLQHLTPAIDRVTGEEREFFERAGFRLPEHDAR